MKTTIDLPDALLLQAKVAAARRRTTLKKLVVEGLEHVIHSAPVFKQKPPIALDSNPLFDMDAYGVTVLKSRGVSVTEELIAKMREEERI